MSDSVTAEKRVYQIGNPCGVCASGIISSRGGHLVCFNCGWYPPGSWTSNTTSAAAEVAGAKEAGRFTGSYTADNDHSNSVAADGRSRAQAPPSSNPNLGPGNVLPCGCYLRPDEAEPRLWFCNAHGGGHAHSDVVRAMLRADETSAPHPDEARLDLIAAEYLHLIPFDMPTGQGDADVGWRALQSHMRKPEGVEIACVYRDDIREAIDAARVALKTNGDVS